MTHIELSLLVFAALNGIRVVAYLPQIIRIRRDPHGAAAVSILTWVLFAAANLATVGYYLVVVVDLIVAAAFALNAGGCLAIVAVTMVKRRSCAGQQLPVQAD
jgi:hypothetical protein